MGRRGTRRYGSMQAVLVHSRVRGLFASLNPEQIGLSGEARRCESFWSTKHVLEKCTIIAIVRFWMIIRGDYLAAGTFYAEQWGGR